MPRRVRKQQKVEDEAEASGGAGGEGGQEQQAVDSAPARSAGSFKVSAAPPSDSEAEESDDGGCSDGDDDGPWSAEGEAGPSSPATTATAAPSLGKGAKRRAAKRARPRLSWTPELHKEFCAAVTKLGGPWTATPKAILDLMAGHGLTLTNVKSHLQKFRLKASKASRLEQQHRAAADASAVLAATYGAGAGLGGGTGLGGGMGLSGGLGMGGGLPGMVPVTAIGSGSPAQLLRNTLPGGLPGQEASLPPGLQLGAGAAPEAAAASQSLAAARQQQDLAFDDAMLGAQAAMWRRRQQQVQAALATALQAQQQAAAAAAAGQGELAGAKGSASAGEAQVRLLQAAQHQHRLLRLQQENLQCLRHLYAAHMIQMQRHLVQASLIKGGPASSAAKPGALPSSAGEHLAPAGQQQQQQVQQVQPMPQQVVTVEVLERRVAPLKLEGEPEGAPGLVGASLLTPKAEPTVAEL